MLHNLIGLLRHGFSLCYLCGLSHNGSELICQRCHTYFEANQHACRCCAMPISSLTTALCGQCQQSTGYIDNTIAPWRYQQPLTHLIHDFKYHHHLCLAPFLARCIDKCLPKPLHDIDYLIPMPIHPKRLRYRGYNQTSLLAKYLSKKMAIPVNQSLCHRSKFQGPQALMKQSDRINNTSNAFTAKDVTRLSLVIVDDLITTGATANALAKTLKIQGAKRVDLWCIARQY